MIILQLLMLLSLYLDYVIQLPGEGLPYMGSSVRGTWYITIHVSFPDVLTYSQIDGI